MQQITNIFNNIRSMYPLQYGKTLTTAMMSASIGNVFYR